MPIYEIVILSVIGYVLMTILTAVLMYRYDIKTKGTFTIGDCLWISFWGWYMILPMGLVYLILKKPIKLITKMAKKIAEAGLDLHKYNTDDDQSSRGPRKPFR